MTQLELFPEVIEAEKKAEADERAALVESLPFYPEPRNDNERLCNLQKQYLTTLSKSDEANLWLYCCKVAERIILKEHHEKHFKLSREDLEDKKINAVEYILRRYQKKYKVTRTRNYKYWAVGKSFICAIYKGVIHSLYHQTFNEEIESEALGLIESGYGIREALAIAQAHLLDRHKLKNRAVEDFNYIFDFSF